MDPERPRPPAASNGEPEGPDGEEGRVHRRNLLAGGAVAGAGLWIAPTVLSRDVAAGSPLGPQGPIGPQGA